MQESWAAERENRGMEYIYIERGEVQTVVASVSDSCFNAFLHQFSHRGRVNFSLQITVISQRKKSDKAGSYD